MISETVGEALDELRARLDGERVDYAELVVLGARTKARQLPDDAKAAREAALRLAGWAVDGPSRLTCRLLRRSSVSV